MNKKIKDNKENEFEKKMTIAELYPVLLDFPMLVKYFDINSDKLLDEKIRVLNEIKSGKKINEIQNFYDIFELLPNPNDVHYD